MVFVIYTEMYNPLFEGIYYLEHFITFEVIGFRLGLTVNNFLMDKKWD